MTDEAGKSGFLSFKGQMAARYKERQSMAFDLGKSFLEAHQPELSSAEDRAASQEAVMDAQDNRFDLLTKTRSKYSFGEHAADVGHTATSSGAAIFGGRPLASTQITHSINNAFETSSISGHDLGNSSAEAKVEFVHDITKINLNSMVQSSLFELNNAKTSVTSLTAEVTGGEQMELENHCNSLLNLDKNHIEECKKCQNTEASCVSNTNIDCAKVDLQEKVTEQSSNEVKDDNVSGVHQDTSSQMSTTARISADTSSQDQHLSSKASSTVYPPLRINLRSHAMRRKVNRENLAAIHKKELRKQTLASKQMTGVVGSGAHEKNNEEPRHKLTRIKEKTFRSVKEGQAKSAVTSSDGDDGGQVISPLQIWRQKINIKNWRRHLDKDDKKVGKENGQAIIEKYLKFLKDKNASLEQLPSTNMKKEQWTVSRPPTPHSASTTRKGSHTSSKASLKETTKGVATPSVATILNNLEELLQKKQIFSTNSQAEALINVRPESRVSVKDHGTDSSTADQVCNLLVSSSNSIISSSWGDRKSPGPRKQPKRLEKPGYKIPRPTKKSPATTGQVSGEVLSNSCDAIPKESPVTKREDSSKKYKSGLSSTNTSSEKAHAKGHETCSLSSTSSLRHASSNLPLQTKSTKKSNLKESVGGTGSTFLVKTNDTLADHELITDCLKDLPRHNLSISRTALFSSSIDSNFCDGSLAKKQVSTEALKIIEFPSAMEPVADKPAVADTLQTQFMSTKKPVCATTICKTRETSFNLGNMAKADYSKYVLNHRPVYIPSVFHASSGATTSREKMEIYSKNKRATSKKYSPLYRSSPKGSRLQVPRHLPTMTMTPSSAEMVDVTCRECTSHPMQHEEYVAKWDARLKQAENMRRYSLFGLSPKVSRQQGPRLPKMAMTPSSAEMGDVTCRKSTSQPMQREESVAKCDARLKQAENIKHPSLPVNLSGKFEAQQVTDKVDKTPSDSPMKKKRKVDKGKKVKKKKKKKKDEAGIEMTVTDGIRNMQKSTKEKRTIKKKVIDNTETQKEITDVIHKADVHEKSEKLGHAEWKLRENKDTLTEHIEPPVSKKEKVKKLLVTKAGKREVSDTSKASGESFKSKKKNTEGPLCSARHLIHPQKDTEGPSCSASQLTHPQKDTEAPPCSAKQLAHPQKDAAAPSCSASQLAHQQDSFYSNGSPGVSIRQGKTLSNSNCSYTLKLDLARIARLKYQATDRFPVRSRIPQLIVLPAVPRKKLDKITQYRRLIEAMLYSKHPSKLPLTRSFRKSLDSAITEEFALHCWHPSGDCDEDSQSSSWSHSLRMQDNILKAGIFGHVTGGHLKVGREKCLQTVTAQTHLLIGSSCVTLASRERIVGWTAMSYLRCGRLEYCVATQRYCWESCRNCVASQRYCWESCRYCVVSQRYCWESCRNCVGSQRYCWESCRNCVGSQRYCWESCRNCVGSQRYCWESCRNCVVSQRYCWESCRNCVDTNSVDFCLRSSRIFVECSKGRHQHVSVTVCLLLTNSRKKMKLFVCQIQVVYAYRGWFVQTEEYKTQEVKDLLHLTWWPASVSSQPPGYNPAGIVSRVLLNDSIFCGHLAGASVFVKSLFGIVETIKIFPTVYFDIVETIKTFHTVYFDNAEVVWVFQVFSFVNSASLTENCNNNSKATLSVEYDIEDTFYGYKCDTFKVSTSYSNICFSRRQARCDQICSDDRLRHMNRNLFARKVSKWKNIHQRRKLMKHKLKQWFFLGSMLELVRVNSSIFGGTQSVNVVTSDKVWLLETASDAESVSMGEIACDPESTSISRDIGHCSGASATVSPYNSSALVEFTLHMSQCQRDQDVYLKRRPQTCEGRSPKGTWENKAEKDFSTSENKMAEKKPCQELNYRYNTIANDMPDSSCFKRLFSDLDCQAKQILKSGSVGNMMEKNNNSKDQNSNYNDGKSQLPQIHHQQNPALKQPVCKSSFSGSKKQSGEGLSTTRPQRNKIVKDREKEWKKHTFESSIDVPEMININTPSNKKIQTTNDGHGEQACMQNMLPKMDKYCVHKVNQSTPSVAKQKHHESGLHHPQPKLRKKLYTPNQMLVSSGIPRYQLRMASAASNRKHHLLMQDSIQQKPFLHCGSLSNENILSHKEKFKHVKFPHGRQGESFLEENSRHPAENSYSKDVYAGSDMEDNISIVANTNSRHSDKYMNPAIMHTQGKISHATREDTGSKITLPYKSQTKQQTSLQFDKKANKNPRQSDVMESQGNFKYYCDDTDTYKAGATWTDDTTCSRSLKWSKGTKSRGFYPDPRVIQEMQRKVEILVQSYRDFLKHEKEKQEQEGNMWGKDDVEATSNIRGHGSRNGKLLKPTAGSTASRLPQASDLRQACDGDLSSQIEIFGKSHECLHREFLGQSVRTADDDGKESTSDKVEEYFHSKNQKTQISNDSCGVARRQLNSVNSSSVAHGITTEALNACHRVTNVPVKKSLIPKPSSSCKRSVLPATAKTCVESYSPGVKGEENAQNGVSTKQASGKDNPSYDLFITYNIQNGGLRCRNLTSAQQELGHQASLAEGDSQCFNFLVNDKDASMYTFNNDVAPVSKNDTTALSKFTGGTSLKPGASRIPVYGRSKCIPKKTNSQLDEACEYQHGIQMSGERNTFQRKKALAEQRSLYKDGPTLENRRARVRFPLTLVKLPIPVQKHTTKRTDRSRIPVAFWHTQQDHQKAGERNMQPFSMLTCEPEDIYDIDYLRSFQLHAPAGASAKDVWHKQLLPLQLENDSVTNSTNKALAQQKAAVITEQLSWILGTSREPRDGDICDSYYQPFRNVTAQSMNMTAQSMNVAERQALPRHKSDNPVSKFQKYSFDSHLRRSKLIPGVAIKQHGRLVNVKDKEESYTAARQRFEPRPTTQKSVSARIIGKPKLSLMKQADDAPTTKQLQFSRSSLRRGKGGFATKQHNAWVEGHYNVWNQNKQQSMFRPYLRNQTKEHNILRHKFHSKNVMMPTLKKSQKNAVVFLQTTPKENTVVNPGDDALHSGSVTFKSIPSGSSIASCLSLMMSSETSRTSLPLESLTGSQGEGFPWMLPVSVDIPTQSVSFDPQTSSWCSTSVGFDKQTGLPCPGTRHNDSTQISDTSGDDNNVKGPQLSRSYSESQFNLSQDKSNGETSSFSTMKNISDLPFTFTSNSDGDDISTLLFSSDQCRGDLQRHVSKNDDLMISNCNFSNRKNLRTSSEPNLSAVCSSQRIWQSKSVIEIHSGPVLAAKSGMEAGKLIMCLGNRVDPFDVGIGKSICVGTQSGKNSHKTFGTRRACDIKVTNEQSRQVNDRPAPTHVNMTMSTFLSELHSVFQRKKILDNSHNKNPRQKKIVTGNRIKYSPKSLQTKSKTNLVYICNKISPPHVQAPERNVNQAVIDASSRRPQGGGSLVTRTQIKEQVPRDSPRKSSPRALPTFSNILQFWEGINTMLNRHKADRGSKASGIHDKGGNNLKPAESLQDNPTEFHSIVDNTVDQKCHDRQAIEPPFKAQGKDGSRRTVNIAANTTAKQYPISTIDTQKCCEIISFLDMLIQQCRIPRKPCHNSQIEDEGEDLPGVNGQPFVPITTSAPLRYNRQMINSVAKDVSVQLENVHNGVSPTHVQKLSQDVKCPVIELLTSAVTKIMRKVSSDVSNISSRDEFKSINETCKTDTLSQVYKPLLEVGNSPSSSSAVEATSPRMTRCSNIRYTSQEPRSDATFIKRKRPFLHKGFKKESRNNRIESCSSSASDLCFLISLGLDYTSDSSLEQSGNIIKAATSKANRGLVQRRPHKSVKSLAYKTTGHDVLKAKDQTSVKFCKWQRKNVKKNLRKSLHKSEVGIPDKIRASKRDECGMIVPIDLVYSGSTQHCLHSAKRGVSEQSCVEESRTTKLELEDVHLVEVSSSMSTSTFTKERRVDTSEEITTNQVHSSELDKLTVSSCSGRCTSQFETRKLKHHHTARSQTLLNTASESPARIWLNTRRMKTKKGEVHTQLFTKQNTLVEHGANTKDVLPATNTVHEARQPEDKDVTPEQQKIPVIYVNDNCQTGQLDCRTVVLKKTLTFGSNNSRESHVLCKKQQALESSVKDTAQRVEYSDPARSSDNTANRKLKIHLSPWKSSASSRKVTHSQHDLNVCTIPESRDSKKVAQHTTSVSFSEDASIRMLPQKPLTRDALPFLYERTEYTARSPPRSVVQARSRKDLPVKHYTLDKDDKEGNERRLSLRTGQKVKTMPASSNKQQLYGGERIKPHKGHRRTIFDSERQVNKQDEGNKRDILQLSHLLGSSPSEKLLCKDMLYKATAYSKSSPPSERTAKNRQQLKSAVKFDDCGTLIRKNAYPEGYPVVPVCKNKASEEESRSLTGGLDLLYSPVSYSDTHSASWLADATWRHGMCMSSPSDRRTETSQLTEPPMYRSRLDVYNKIMERKELVVNIGSSSLQEPPGDSTTNGPENSNTKSLDLFSHADPPLSVKGDDFEKCENAKDLHKQSKYRNEDPKYFDVRSIDTENLCPHTTPFDEFNLPSSINQYRRGGKESAYSPSSLKPLKSAGKTDIQEFQVDQIEVRRHADCKAYLQESTNIPYCLGNNSQEYQSCNSNSLVAEAKAKCVPITCRFYAADKDHLRGEKENHCGRNSLQEVIIPAGSQNRLMKQSSAPCLSVTSEMDKYKSINSVLRIPLARQASSRDVAKTSGGNQIPTVSHPKIRINHEPISTRQDRKELSWSMSTATTSKPSGQISSSRRSRDIEIVVGNDISIREFMSCLLNCLQITSPEKSKDEGSAHLLLNTQIRQVIDSILNGQIMDTAPNVNESKASGHEHVSKDATKEAEIGGRGVSAALLDAGANSQGGRLDVTGDHSTKPASEVNQSIFAHTSHQEKNTCDLPVPVKQTSQLNESDPNKVKRIYHSKDSPEQSSNEENRGENAYNTHIFTKKPLSKDNLNVYQSKVAIGERKKQSPVSSSSTSDSGLSRNPGIRIRRERYVCCRGHPKLGCNCKSKNVVLARELMLVEGKLPCVSAPALNLLEATREGSKHYKTPFRNRARAVRKLSTNEIRLSKPQNYHLDKVIKSDNTVTVTVLPHKTKGYAQTKAEVGRAHFVASKPVKGLNETLLEKESQKLLYKETCAGHEHVPNSAEYRSLRDSPEVPCCKHQQSKQGQTCNKTAHGAVGIAMKSPQILKEKKQATHKGHKGKDPAIAVHSIVVSGTTKSVREREYKDAASSRVAYSFPSASCSNSLSENVRHRHGGHKRNYATPTVAKDSTSWSCDQDLLSLMMSKRRRKYKLRKHEAHLGEADDDEKAATEFIANIRKVIPQESPHKLLVSSATPDRSNTIKLGQIVKLLREVLSDKGHGHINSVDKDTGRTGQKYHKDYDVKEVESHIARARSPKSCKQSNNYFTNKDKKADLLGEPGNQCRETAFTDSRACIFDNRVAENIVPHMTMESRKTPYAACASSIEPHIRQSDEQKTCFQGRKLASIYTASEDQVRNVRASTHHAKREEVLKKPCFEADEQGSVCWTSFGKFRSVSTATDDFAKDQIKSCTGDNLSITNVISCASPVHCKTVGTTTDSTEVNWRSVADDGCSFPDSADLNMTDRCKNVATSTEMQQHSFELAQNSCLQASLGGRGIMSDIGISLTPTLVEAEGTSAHTNMKPPPSPHSSRKSKLNETLGVGERNVQQTSILGSTYSIEPSQMPRISQKSSLAGALQFTVPASVIDFDNSKQNQLLTCLAHSSSHVVHGSKIKVNAPCSMVTVKNINVSVVSGADGKSIKLLMPPDDSQESYNIEVKPDCGNDGTAMVVAEKGMVQVTFETTTRENNPTEFSTSKASHSLNEESKDCCLESSSSSAYSASGSSYGSVNHDFPVPHGQQKTSKYACEKRHQRKCASPTGPITGSNHLTVIGVSYMNLEPVKKRTLDDPVSATERVGSLPHHEQYRLVNEASNVQKRSCVSLKINSVEMSNTYKRKASHHHSPYTNLARLEMSDYKRPRDKRDCSFKSLAMAQDMVAENADKEVRRLTGRRLRSEDRYTQIETKKYSRDRGDGCDQINRKFSPLSTHIERNKTSGLNSQLTPEENSASEEHSSACSEAEEEDSDSESMCSDNTYVVTAEDDSGSTHVSSENSTSESADSDSNAVSHESCLTESQTSDSIPEFLPKQTSQSKTNSAVPQTLSRQPTHDSQTVVPQTDSLTRKTVVKFKEPPDCDVFTVSDRPSRGKSLGHHPDSLFRHTGTLPPTQPVTLMKDDIRKDTATTQNNRQTKKLNAGANLLKNSQFYQHNQKTLQNQQQLQNRPDTVEVPERIASMNGHHERSRSGIMKSTRLAQASFTKQDLFSVHNRETPDIDFRIIQNSESFSGRVNEHKATSFIPVAPQPPAEGFYSVAKGNGAILKPRPVLGQAHSLHAAQTPLYTGVVDMQSSHFAYGMPSSGWQQHKQQQQQQLTYAHLEGTQHEAENLLPRRHFAISSAEINPAAPQDTLFWQTRTSAVTNFREEWISRYATGESGPGISSGRTKRPVRMPERASHLTERADSGYSELSTPTDHLCEWDRSVRMRLQERTNDNALKLL